jgi:drug/metabolite transporter (DMT)-like permease
MLAAAPRILRCAARPTRPGRPLTLTVLAAVLFAALLHASWNALLKSGTDVLLDTGAIVAGTALVAAPFLLVLPLPAPASWPCIVASALIHLAYYWLMINAYRTGDLSLVYPLMRGTAPLITAVLGVAWLQELPSGAAWLGIGLISLGVFALALRTAGYTPSGRAVSFALANAVVIAIYTIVDGTGARQSGNAWSYICWLFVVDAIPFTLYLAASRPRSFVHALATRRWRGLVGGGLSAGAYAISVWAMTQAPVAMVAALRETSVLFAALIGTRVLRERLGPRRWAGAVAIVLGAFALKLA